MNDILVIHEQRMEDKNQIIEGLENKCLKQPQFQYYERERQRQKKENLLINQLKKMNKNFNQIELKKTFFSTALNIMNSYLHQGEKIKMKSNQITVDNFKTQETEKNSEHYVSIHPQVFPIKSNNQQTRSQPNIEKPQILNDQDQFPNFYQTYINLFVNFFNTKAQQRPTLIKLDNIRSIIRPNNKFVIVDLLKALLEYGRNDFRLLLKTFLNDETIKQNYLLKKHAEILKMELDDIQESQENQNTIDLHEDKKFKRRVQTQPEVNFTDLLDVELRNEIIKLNPLKKSCNKNSIINLLKRNSTQLLRTKTDQNEVIRNRVLHAQFIETNIKQTVYEKNYEFISQLNLQKLESRVNSLYIQLTRMNSGNSQTIGKFYEQSLGKKNKFNYDQRGLYSQSQIQSKKDILSWEIKAFQVKHQPRSKSSSIQLTEYALQFIKNKEKSEELRQLSKTIKISKPISNWLPLRIQRSLSIVQPLRLQIQQINQTTGEMMSYHWKKYRKQFSLIEFLKQHVKAQYDRVLTKNVNIDKNLETEIFKKKKFKKSLFVDNRKKINQLLYSNNVIYSKKQSIFPVLKGIQENYIKNASNINTIINQHSHALENSMPKHKDVRTEISQRKINNSLSKHVFNHNNKPKDQEKRFESMKKILVERQNSQRNYSESQKILERLPSQERQKCDFFCKLSTKRDTPKSVTNRNVQKHMQKYEKKSLISMSKIMDLKSEASKGQSISKTVQIVSMMAGKKLTVLNLS